MDRFAQFSVATADMALADAGTLGADPERAGVVFATGVGGFETLTEQVLVCHERGPRRVSPFLVPMMMANAGRQHLDAGRVPRSFGDRRDRVCRGHPRHRGRRTPGGVGPVRRGGRAEARSAAMHRVAIAAFTNMTALSTTGAVAGRSTSGATGSCMTEGAPGRWCSRTGTGRSPEGRRDLCRGGRSRQHCGRTPHHGPPARRRRGGVLHGTGVGGRGAPAGRHRPHQRPRDLDPAERPRRVACHQQGVRRARAAGDLHQGGDRSRLGGRRGHRGGGLGPSHRSPADPPDRRARGTRPRHPSRRGAGRATALGAGAGALQLVRVRRPQRLPHPSAGPA